MQLSAQRWAWIEKEHTVPTTAYTATVNTGSWSIVREDRVDRISVALPCRLPYSYFTLLDPSTIPSGLVLQQTKKAPLGQTSL